MLKQRTYAEWFSLVMGAMICIQLVIPKTIAIAFIVILALVIAGIVKKELIFKLNSFMVCFVLLYAAYAIGCFFTHHWNWASHYLESKLSFVFFPILFSFRLKQSFSLRPVTLGLIAANVILVIIGLKTGLAYYSLTHDAKEAFTSVYFSPVHHPTYLAAFNLFTLAACWYGHFQRWKGFNRITVVVFTLFSIVVHVLCLSLAGLLLLTIVAGVFILYMVAKRFGRWAAAGMIAGVPIVLVVLFLSIPTIGGEVKDLGNAVSHYAESPNRFVFEKTGYRSGGEVRLIMWTVSTMEFMQHPMGVGTGNVDEYLGYRLYKSNQQEMVPKEYNPHNQYLQTAVEIGVFGLLILLSILVSGFRFARKHKNWLLLICLAALVFNCLFESMLQRNSGIVFFTWIPCLLIVYSNSKLSGKTNDPQQPITVS